MTTRRYRVTVNGQVFEVEVEEVGGPAAGPADGAAPPAAAPAPAAPAPAAAESPRAAAAQPTPSRAGGEEPVTAPLPGLVLDVRVAPGQRVRAGEVLVILEAMKMENEVAAPRDGTVKEVPVRPGQTVDQGEVLVVLA